MTNEEWIRHAVEVLDSVVFEGDLDLLNHPFQISWGKTSGKKLTEVLQPYDGEDVRLEDFFPTTISVNYTIKDPEQLLGNLALECIHAFFNEKSVGSKRFKKLAEKYYFEKPYKTYNPSAHLSDLISSAYEELKSLYGKFPGTPITFHEKEKKERKKSTYVMFCPNCGYEVKVSAKMFDKHGKGSLTCVCGTKMGIDLTDEENNDVITDE